MKKISIMLIERNKNAAFYVYILFSIFKTKGIKDVTQVLCM